MFYREIIMIKLNFIPGTKYKIYSDDDKFSFGIDAILLSDYAKIKNNSKVLEIGGGTGIISMRINYLYHPSKVYCVEIQEDNFNILKNNIKVNNLENRIEIFNEDINNCYSIFKNDSLDYIVTNPPYYRNNAGIKNKDRNQYISRYEVFLNLDDIFKFAKYKLKTKGELYMINRPSRIVDILTSARKYNIEPKRMRIVNSKSDEEAKMVLIKFIKNSGNNFEMEKPLIIYNENNEYTEEVKRIYYG